MQYLKAIDETSYLSVPNSPLYRKIMRFFYKEYEKVSGINLTSGRKPGIRKNIEDHSSDSMNYKGKEDLFYSVDGIGNGTW